MKSEIERITRMLEKTFDKQPWYGPSIMETLKMTPATAEKRHGQAHSIIELVRHMISWRVFATRRLRGDNDYEVTDAMNFPTTGTWDEAINELQNSQRALLEAVQKFPPDRFDELVPSKTMKYTYYTLLQGIIQHDIYHLGQIAYVKKSFS